jgi:uncharacterized protein (TIGR03067 family)
MKKIMFGVAALLLALAITDGARAQNAFGPSKVREGLAGAPQSQTKQWQGVSLISDGKPETAAQDKAIRATTDGSNFTLSAGGKVLMQGTYKLNKSTKPKQVDLIASAGAGKSAGVQLKGIYQVEGDTLKVCVANPGKPRPTQFSSQPGSGYQMLVMKLVKTDDK